MRGKKEIVYQSLNHNCTYGNLATETFWDNAVEEERARREEERREREQRRQQQKQSSVRVYEPLMKKAEKPLIRDVDRVQPQVRQSVTTKLVNEIMLKLAGGIAVAILVLAELCSVIVNQQIMNVRTELVALQRMERELISANNEMRIVVEQLKGPERIRNIATKELGLVVARDNVYVSSTKIRTVGDYYREGTGKESNAVFAVNR